MSDHPGTLVAVGNTSTIHEWGRTQVVKVMLPDTPAGWADLEADWTRRLHAIGLPVPEVVDVLDVAGRRAIRYERVVGPTMLAEVVGRPSSLPAHAHRLAELQALLHATPPPEGLPRLLTRVRAKIQSADLPDDVRADVLEELAALPAGDRICHGDLHPGNVILADVGPVVVDWFDVAVGHPLADVARTSLLVRPRLRSPVPAYLPGVTNDLLQAFHDRYLAAYAGLTGADIDALAGWEVPIAAARLSENVEREDLDAIVRRGRPAGRRGQRGVTHGPGSVVADGPG